MEECSRKACINCRHNTKTQIIVVSGHVEAYVVCKLNGTIHQSIRCCDGWASGF